LRAFHVLDEIFCVGGSEQSAPEDGSVYLVQGPDELWLIDSGCGNSVDAIIENIQGLGFDPSRISKIIATHCHIDHCGGLAELQKRFNPEIIAHAGDVDALEGRAPEKVAAEFYGIDYHPVRVSTVLREARASLSLGSQELVLQHVPGHTPGSIVVWGDFPGGRVLFGQDLHGPLHPNWGSDRQAWKKSLEQLLKLDADVLAEGHFGVISPAENVKLFIKRFLYS